MAQQERIIEEVKRSFSWVDIIFGPHTIGYFPNLLRERMSTGKKQVQILKDNFEIPKFKNTKRLYKHKALINITYGCNNFCTYCIVPYTRGREKSRTLSDVINEIKTLRDEGVIEVMLLGQNVNSFKDVEGNDFSDLIRKVNDIDGIKRIRFMTSHPKDISDKLIDCYMDCENLSNHIHLPVQSGNDNILRRMNRHYTLGRYRNVINKLREASPNISITTDIITGFPGESEDEFEDTLNLVRDVQFDNAFTFIYSKRPGTPAAEFPDQIPYEIKHDRFERLVNAVNESAYKKNKVMENKTVEVLVDKKSSKNSEAWSGRTDDFRLVNFQGKGKEDLTGKIIPVKINVAKTFSLDGIEISQEDVLNE